MVCSNLRTNAKVSACSGHRAHFSGPCPPHTPTHATGRCCEARWCCSPACLRSSSCSAFPPPPCPLSATERLHPSDAARHAGAVCRHVHAPHPAAPFPHLPAPLSTTERLHLPDASRHAGAVRRHVYAPHPAAAPVHSPLARHAAHHGEMPRGCGLVHIQWLLQTLQGLCRSPWTHEPLHRGVLAAPSHRGCSLHTVHTTRSTQVPMLAAPSPAYRRVQQSWEQPL